MIIKCEIIKEDHFNYGVGRYFLLGGALAAVASLCANRMIVQRTELSHEVDGEEEDTQHHHKLEYL